jgi:hypothetical protein
MSHGLSEKSNRTSSSEPRITDRLQGARGLSARHPRTVRTAAADCPKPLPSKAQNQNGSKANRARTRRTRDEHCTRGLSASPTRTVRASRTEARTARPRKSTPPTHHRISQMVEVVETRVWGHDMRQPRMLYPKHFAS